MAKTETTKMTARHIRWAKRNQERANFLNRVTPPLTLEHVASMLGRGHMPSGRWRKGSSDFKWFRRTKPQNRRRNKSARPHMGRVLATAMGGYWKKHGKWPEKKRTVTTA